MIKTSEAKGLMLLALIVVEIAAIPLLLRAFIYSVSIPLYFVSFGYERTEHGSGMEIKKNVLHNLLCWGMTVLISFGYCILNSKEIHLSEMLNTVTPVWVVLALCIVSTVYEFICMLEQRMSTILAAAIVVVLTMAGVFFGYKKRYLPLGADVMLVAVFFVFFGDMLRRIGSGMLKNKIIWFVLFLGIWGVLVYFGRWMELPIRAYRGHILGFVSSCAGCVCVLYAASFLKKWKGISAFLSWCGERSILFLCVIGFVQSYMDWMDLYAYIPVTWVEDAVFRVCMLVFIVFCIGVLKEKLVALNCE